MDCLLVIKIPFQQLLHLIFIRGSWSFNKPRSHQGTAPRRLGPTSNFASPPNYPAAPCHPAAGRRAVREAGSGRAGREQEANS